jgi:hypothetical protein
MMNDSGNNYANNTGDFASRIEKHNREIENGEGFQNY